MKKLTLEPIIENIGGKLLQGSSQILVDNFVSKFVRLRSGALFFDMYHEKHEFELATPDLGLCAIVTDSPENFKGLGENVSVVKVDDIENAFWMFVDFYRGQFHFPVIGVTGTCGKTTTKEIIKHILSGWYRVNATYKSYNAQIRHLSYLLDFNDRTQAAVIEMGVAAPGDLKICCRFFKPQVGVITNIGIDHMGTFGTLDAYIKGKAEMLDSLGKGTLILNCDDDNIRKIDLKGFKGKVVYFGYSEKADYRILDVKTLAKGLGFMLQYKEKVYYFTIPGYASFNVYNAVAAIAAVHSIGVEIKDAGDRLADFQNIEKHFEFKQGINGSTIIDDTWSANPSSTEMAVKLLKRLSQGKKTVAVLGRMALLGKHSDEYHHIVGEKIAESGIDELVIIGEDAEEIGLGAIRMGMSRDKVHFCKNSDDSLAVLQSILDENSIALVKTSMILPHSDLMGNLVK